MKHFTHLRAIFGLLLFSQLAVAQSPGGVSSGIQIWLKSNVGAGTVGSASATWTDQSIAGHNATQSSALIRPTLTANRINKYPAMVFDGANTYMQIANNLGLTGTSAYAAYAVVRQQGSGTQIVLGSQSAVTGDFQYRRDIGTGVATDPYGSGSQITGATVPAVNTWYISGMERTGTGTGQASIYLNGTLDATGTVSQSLGAGNKVLGASTNGILISYFLNGDIAELIIYNAALSATDRQRLNSYLSLKYGIPVAGSMLNSAGTTTWTSTVPYTNRIFGITRDDNSGLSQLSSYASSTGNGDGTAISGAGQVTLTTTALTNLDNITIGDNGGALTETATNLPSGSSPLTRRITRAWRVQRTNASGVNPTLTFNTTGLTVTGTTAADFGILLNSAGDATFATGANTYIPASSYSGNVATFANVNLPTGSAFTFITKYVNTLPLNFTSFTGRSVSPHQVDLQWQTANESNVSHFEVERSADGASFSTIGSVSYADAHQFAYTDANALAGASYYRIKDVDLDNRFLYSPVIRISSGSSPALSARLYNNGPGSGDPVLEISSPAESQFQLRLLSTSGSLLQSMSLKVGAGTLVRPIATGALPRGVYRLEVRSANYRRTLQFVK